MKKKYQQKLNFRTVLIFFSLIILIISFIIIINLGIIDYSTGAFLHCNIEGNIICFPYNLTTKIVVLTLMTNIDETYNITKISIFNEDKVYCESNFSNKIITNIKGELFEIECMKKHQTTKKGVAYYNINITYFLNNSSLIFNGKIVDFVKP